MVSNPAKVGVGVQKASTARIRCQSARLSPTNGRAAQVGILGIVVHEQIYLPPARPTVVRLQQYDRRGPTLATINRDDTPILATIYFVLRCFLGLRSFVPLCGPPHRAKGTYSIGSLQSSVSTVSRRERPWRVTHCGLLEYELP